MSPFQTTANRFTYRMAVVTRHQRQQALTRWQLQHADQQIDKPDSATSDSQHSAAPRLTPANREWRRTR